MRPGKARLSRTAPAAPRVSQASAPLPRDPSGERIWPLGPETDFWGFPVYYSAKIDQQRRQQGKLAAREAARRRAERERTVREAAQQRDADRARQRAREDDYSMFLVLSQRYGPLPGLLYSATERPGQVYQQVVRAAAAVIVRWGRHIIPAVRRWHANLAARTFVRGTLRRGFLSVMEIWEKELLARRALHRHFNRLQLRIVRKWRRYTRQMLRIRWVQRRHRDQHWDALWAYAQETWRTREIKVNGQRRIQQKRNKRIIFAAWVSYMLRNRRIRHMWRDNALRTVHPYMRMWKHWVWKRPHNAATAIQRTLRDYNWRLFRGAQLLQAAFRGYRWRQARPEAVARWREAVTAARRQYWEQKLRPAVEQELARWADEWEAAQPALDEARAAVRLLLGGRVGKKQLSVLATQLQVAAKRERRMLPRPLALFRARRKMLFDAEQHALLLHHRRFRRDRPPPFACLEPGCRRTFVVEHQLQHHAHALRPDEPAAEVALAAQAQMDGADHARAEQSRARVCALRRSRRQQKRLRAWQDAVLRLTRQAAGGEELRARVRAAELPLGSPRERLKPGSVVFDDEHVIRCAACTQQFASFAARAEHQRGADGVCVRRVRRLAEERAARRNVAHGAVLAQLASEDGKRELAEQQRAVEHEFTALATLSPRSQREGAAALACAAVDVDGARSLTFADVLEVAQDLRLPYSARQLDAVFRERLDPGRVGVAPAAAVVDWLAGDDVAADAFEFRRQHPVRAALAGVVTAAGSGRAARIALKRMAARAYRSEFPADSSTRTSPRARALGEDAVARSVRS